LPLYNSQIPNGVTKFIDNKINLMPLMRPIGSEAIRKLLLPYWLICELGKVFKSIRNSKAIHCPLPSDIGFIYLIIGLVLKKKIFIRHCGTWGNKTTLSDRFIYWLLPKIAFNQIVVMATGGGKEIPDSRNSNIKWIFSTSIPKTEWNEIKPARPWNGASQLRLVYVGRLSKNKNIDSILKALCLLKKKRNDVYLDILGKGDQMDRLRSLTAKLKLKDNVSFHGSVGHKIVLKYLCNSHL